MAMLVVVCVPGSPFVALVWFSFVHVCVGAFPFVAFFLCAFSCVAYNNIAIILRVMIVIVIAIIIAQPFAQY